jgi:hypothetical protein
MSKNRGKSKLSNNVLFNANKHVFHCEKSLGTLFYGQPSVETSVRNKCRCSFYCALFTLHVSVPIGGHLQVICNTKKFEGSYCICRIFLCYKSPEDGHQYGPKHVV